MREIKFRAYADGKMFNNVGVVGNIIVLEYDSCEDDYGVDLELNYYGLNDDSIKLMQFTGLHDKNGKEIYEGDILFVEIYGNLGDISEEECFNAKIVWLDNAFHLVDSEGDTWTEWLTTYQGKDVKIIGNKYENPELLKEEVR